jgi:hypothetical protein
MAQIVPHVSAVPIPPKSAGDGCFANWCLNMNTDRDTGRGTSPSGLEPWFDRDESRDLLQRVCGD